MRRLHERLFPDRASGRERAIASCLGPAWHRASPTVAPSRDARRWCFEFQKVRSTSMVRTHLALGALGVTASLLISFSGCGSDATNPDDATAAGTSGGSGDVGLPPKPGPQNPGDGQGVVLAIRKLYLGDTDRNGAKSPSAWKTFGFNLD